MLFFLAIPLHSHDPITTKITWAQEVSRIVYKRCAGCHRPGGRAMSLLTYEDARPWAKAIRDEVSSRRMPPWGAVAGVGEFAGDPSLSSPEIDMLIAWVEGGSPEGDPIYLPHRIPDADVTAPAIPAHSRTLRVSGEVLLQRAATLVAIRPEGLAGGASVNGDASLEAWAVLPDESVRRLIWLHDFRKTGLRTYVLRNPEKLPAGTRIRAEGSSVSFLLR
jgi:hypothetical protein